MPVRVRVSSAALFYSTIAAILDFLHFITIYNKKVMKRVKYKKEILTEIIMNSHTIAEVANKLGLTPRGSKYRTIKKYINLYNIDTSHFHGQGWRGGLTHSEKTARIPLEEILKEGTNYRSDTLKKRLVKEGIKEWRCEECGITEWQGKEITLELHHKNGNHFDNRLENLQILCPNCHSQTPAHKGRDGKKYNQEIKTYFEDIDVGYKKICPICGKEFISDRDIRIFCSRDCYNASLKDKSNEITKETLIEKIKEYNTISDVAKAFNVSRPTIRKYLEKYNLLDSLKEKFDFRAKPILQYDINGNFIQEWPSVSDVESTLGIADAGRVANYKRKSSGGYIWRWKE